MPHYFPMPADPTTMPIDISFVFADEKPAGKHGFLKIDGEEMRFEDGTLAKFWGVNVNGACCFPSHDYAEQMARRLAQTGCNLVRFHQLDAEFGTPNIFAFTKGRHVSTTRQLDAQSMDRLDYFMYCLKQEGIYLLLDLLTYRQFKTGDGVVDASQLTPAAKPWCLVDQHMIDLQKEFATQLWTHHNPYTNLQYKDDPAFVLTDIVSECDLFTIDHTAQFSTPAYYANKLRETFRDWLAERGMEYDWKCCDLKSQDQILIDFKLHMTNLYYTQMYDHLRSIGVKIPICGTNWLCPDYHFHVAHKGMDYMDTHLYITDWRYNADRNCYTKAITDTENPPHISEGPRMRLAGKPLFISEWDMHWPNAFRAESAIYFAAIAALQGWSGLAVHTYAYSTRVDKHDPLGRETSTAIGGSHAREGIFTVWNDWARYGMFYHAALIIRRGDIAPATQKIAISPSRLSQCSNDAVKDCLELAQAAVTLDGTLPEGYDKVVMDNQRLLTPGTTEKISCTGQMYRNAGRQFGYVDTPRTKAVYGKLRRTQAGLQLDGMTIASQNNFGVIAISSLTDAPICESDNLLLTAMAQVRNTDQVCAGENIIDAGTTPILAELVQADITMKCKYGKDIKVWGINAEGAYVGSMPVICEGDTIRFSIGDPLLPACYYLIFRQ